MARQQPEGRWEDQSRVLFAGQLTEAIRLMPRGPTDCVGFRLRPAASRSVAGQLLPSWRDQVVDLGPLVPEFAEGLVRAADLLAGRPGSTAWADSLAPLIAALPVDTMMASAVAKLESVRGDERIERLAASAHLGIRQFQARFSASVGMTPKQFARIVRLQAMLKALDQGTAPLAELALEMGFSDQAHATRDLSRVTGMTPAKLLRALKEDRDGDEAVALAAAFIRGGTR